MACELSQFLLIRFSTLDCGSIHEYPRSHLHLLDSLTYSSFRRKFQITGTDLEPKILVNSRIFLGCPYYTAITCFPSSAPWLIAGFPYKRSPASLQQRWSAAVQQDRPTAYFTSAFSAAIFSTWLMFSPTVLIQLVS